MVNKYLSLVENVHGTVLIFILILQTNIFLAVVGIIIDWNLMN